MWQWCVFQCMCVCVCQGWNVRKCALERVTTSAGPCLSRLLFHVLPDWTDVGLPIKALFNSVLMRGSCPCPSAYCLSNLHSTHVNISALLSHAYVYVCAYQYRTRAKTASYWTLFLACLFWTLKAQYRDDMMLQAKFELKLRSYPPLDPLSYFISWDIFMGLLYLVPVWLVLDSN